MQRLLKPLKKYWKQILFTVYILCFATILLASFLSKGDSAFQVKRYVGLKIPVSNEKIVTDADVREKIENKASQSKVEVESVEIGDTITCDYTVTVNGEVVETQYGKEIVVGTDTPWQNETLEEEFLGKGQETVEVKREIPEDFAYADYAGEEATLTFEITGIVRDATLEEYLNLRGMSMEEAEKEVREELTEEMTASFTDKQRTKIEDELLDNIEVKGKIDYSEQYNRLVKRHKTNAKGLGLSFNDYIEQVLKTNREKFEKNCKKAARENTILNKACDIIADFENLEVTKKDREELCKEYGVKSEKDLPFTEKEIQELLLRRVVDDYLLSLSISES